MTREMDFQVVISEWLQSKLPDLIERNIDIPLHPKSIVSLIGGRRVGKTYLMYQLIKRLQKDIDRSNILYVNFEHDRLRNLDASDLDEMLKVFYMLSKPREENRIYLFLDEIHVVRDWDRWVRKIFDERLYHIFISGSSSKLLSREIATSLRGRSIDFIIFPFSFKEYLSTIGFSESISEFTPYIKERGKIIGYLKEYLEFGGYPEVVLEKDVDMKVRLLRSYYEAVFYKDILERYNISSPSLMDIFLRYCIDSHSKYVSISKVYKYLKTLGYKVGKATLFDFLRYANEAFIIFPVEIYSYSIRDRKQYPRKIYILDTGMIKALNIDTSIGRLMENAVFIELMRRSEYMKNFEVFYWKDFRQREVDFIIKRGIKVEELIQVSYASGLDEINRREINGLVKAAEELGCKKLSIITWDLTDEIEKEGYKIRLVPIWMWLLS